MCRVDDFGTCLIGFFPVLRRRTVVRCHWRLKCVSNKTSPPSHVTGSLPQCVRLKPLYRSPMQCASIYGYGGSLWGCPRIRDSCPIHRCYAVISAGQILAVNAADCCASQDWCWQVVRREMQRPERLRIPNDRLQSHGMNRHLGSWFKRQASQVA